MGDDEDGALSLDGLQGIAQRVDARQIHPSGGLVEEEDRGHAEELDRDRDSPLVAAAELGEVLVEGQVAQARDLENGLKPRDELGPHVQSVRVTPTEAQLVHDRVPDEVPLGELEDDAEVSHRRRLRAWRRRLQDYLSVVRGREPRENVEERGLSGAARAIDQSNATGRKVEAHVVQQRPRQARWPVREVSNLQYRGAPANASMTPRGRGGKTALPGQQACCVCWWCPLNVLRTAGDGGPPGLRQGSRSHAVPPRLARCRGWTRSPTPRPLRESAPLSVLHGPAFPSLASFGSGEKQTDEPLLVERGDPIKTTYGEEEMDFVGAEGGGTER